MSQPSEIKRKPVVSKTIFYGVLSLAMYGLFFNYSSVLMVYFTKGLYYAALPILTVFAFSFVHAAFASNVWSLLGVEPSHKQPQPRPAAQPRPAGTTKPQPRVYINT